MLSIGKLAVGQAKYYLDQAQGRVDVIDSVVGGAEDYYAGSGEAQGVWLGVGARELGLGLERAVTGAELRTVLAGVDPRSDAPLRRGSSPVRVAAFDLTFSAPKSVSVSSRSPSVTFARGSGMLTIARLVRRSGMSSGRPRASGAGTLALRCCGGSADFVAGSVATPHTRRPIHRALELLAP